MLIENLTYNCCEESRELTTHTKQRWKGKPANAEVLNTCTVISTQKFPAWTSKPAVFIQDCCEYYSEKRTPEKIFHNPKYCLNNSVRAVELHCHCYR